MPSFRDRGPSSDADIDCPTCGIPLLTPQTPCPKCDPTPHFDAVQPGRRMRTGPRRSRFVPADWDDWVATGKNEMREDLLVASLRLMGGLGLILAFLTVVIDGIGMESLWRAFIAVAVGLGLLSLRRVLGRQPR